MKIEESRFDTLSLVCQNLQRLFHSETRHAFLCVSHLRRSLEQISARVNIEGRIAMVLNCTCLLDCSDRFVYFISASLTQV